MALPSALPVPAPGYSIPFGIVLLLFAFQRLLGRKSPWIPKWAAKLPISIDTSGRTYAIVEKFLGFFERFVRTRFSALVSVLRIPVVIAIIFCATCMLIPIPGTNTPPALAIFLA